MIQGLKQLDGIIFVARIMIEPASNPNYKDANKLANVVTPDEPQYAAVMRGENVPPEPVNAKPRKVEAAVDRAGLGEPGTPRRASPAPWAAGASAASRRASAAPARRADPRRHRPGCKG